MKREWLKEKCPNLTDTEIDVIMAENGNDINKAKGDTKNLEDEVETLKGEKKSLEGQLTTASSTIEQLKNNHATEVTQLARDAINTELIGKYKAKNAKAVMALIDEFEAKDNDDYKTLLDTKLKALSKAEDTKFMFGEVQSKTHYNPTGGGSGDTESMASQIAKERNEEKEVNVENNPYANAWS